MLCMFIPVLPILSRYLVDDLKRSLVYGLVPTVEGYQAVSRLQSHLCVCRQCLLALGPLVGFFFGGGVKL